MKSHVRSGGSLPVRSAALAAHVQQVSDTRPALRFSDAELELRRLHGFESARLLAGLALWRSRSSPLGGATRLWTVPPLHELCARAKDEVQCARHDAAPRVGALEQCAMEPLDRWPSAAHLAEAALELRSGVETKLVRAYVAFVDGRSASSAAIDVLGTCALPRARVLAFALLGFDALHDGDATGARGAFEAARRLRPGDVSLAWLARRFDAAADAGRADAKAELVHQALRSSFAVAALGRRGTCAVVCEAR